MNTEKDSKNGRNAFSPVPASVTNFSDIGENNYQYHPTWQSHYPHCVLRSFSFSTLW